MTVVVLDHGSGNVRSVCRALAAVGAQVELTADASAIGRADGLVVPGVGAFDACVQGLRAVGGAELIHAHLERERPLLGICVGHQVLFDLSLEHGVPSDGLGILRGKVTQLPTERLPHMGWNHVVAPPSSRLLAGVGDRRFYFVHSYAVLTSDVCRPDAGRYQEADAATEPSSTLTVAEHEGVTFVAAIEQGVISATQFHPEKSGSAGLGLLANWLATVRPHLC